MLPENCWEVVSLLASEEGPLPAALAAAGRPGGTKKAKAERNAGSSIAGIDVSITMFVDYMNANTKEL
jgi:hypothetical protein